MFQQTLSRALREFLKTSRPQARFYADSIRVTCKPDFDFEYLVDPINRAAIENNIKRRKSTNNINQIVELYKRFKVESDASKKGSLLEALRHEARKLPNQTHPDVMKHGNDPVTVRTTEPIAFNFRPKEFHELANNMRLLRTEELSTLTGRRSYYLTGELAEMEHALVEYTTSKLHGLGFKIISVPDILPADIIDGCGMNTTGTRSQVFRLEDSHGEDICLAGTAEMGLSALHADMVIDVNDLPILLTSVSRCHRAELSTVKEEQGLFRVHHFTKVEMFGISHPSRSEDLFREFVDIQYEIFASLGLDFNVLDMPANDLGAPAYRKYDIEAWFPGRQFYGEVSSCSNCTDYQSRRLNIKFRDGDEEAYVHTVNGTACAIPRTLMAIFETHQQENGSVLIPKPLRVFFEGQEVIQREGVGVAPQKEEKSWRI